MSPLSWLGYSRLGGFVNTNDIIRDIEAEIARLQQVKAILTGISAKRKPGRPAKATSFDPAEFTKPSKRRTLSAAAREKIAAAQRARWAKSKDSTKKPEQKTAPAKKSVTSSATGQKKKATKPATKKQSRTSAPKAPSAS